MVNYAKMPPDLKEQQQQQMAIIDINFKVLVEEDEHGQCTVRFDNGPDVPWAGGMLSEDDYLHWFKEVYKQGLMRGALEALGIVIPNETVSVSLKQQQ